MRLVLLVIMSSSLAVGSEKPFIAWEHLQNPVYSHEDWSTKDACMAYDGGTFYLFFSAFFWDRGRERSHVAGVTTQDFTTFSEPFFLLDGKEDGWDGMCSPNIARLGDTWFLTYNSWGDKPGVPNQLFYSESKDLEHWEHGKPLARTITRNDGGPVRAIDAAVCLVDERYMLVWKENQTPMIAWGTHMCGGEWERIGPVQTSWFENAQFIEVDGVWHMLVTARGPRPRRDHLPYMARFVGELGTLASWTKWRMGQALSIPLETFNTNSRANAAFVADWREHDGHYYLIYAGHTEGVSHAGRGDNKLGLARSRDLQTWRVPGLR